MDKKLSKPHFEKQFNYDKNHSFDTEGINTQ